MDTPLKSLVYAKATLESRIVAASAKVQETEHFLEGVNPKDIQTKINESEDLSDITPDDWNVITAINAKNDLKHLHETHKQFGGDNLILDKDITRGDAAKYDFFSPSGFHPSEKIFLKQLKK